VSNKAITYANAGYRDYMQEMKGMALIELTKQAVDTKSSDAVGANILWKAVGMLT
jgi:hypothetical protein